MHTFLPRALAAFALLLSGAAGYAADSPEDIAIAGVLNEFVKRGEPGCTVGVLEGGRLTHARAFGLADLERGVQLDARSVFNLASVSKQFTTFALLLLQQDGKLNLDDPVAKYVPEIAKSSAGVTLRHLVHHTGGLRDYIELLTMKGRGDADGATIHETVQALGRQTKPNAAPGIEWDYSNTGYFLLGVVIARVSGQSLAQFSKARIFDPLGMKDTSIVDRYPDGIAWLARGYRREGAGFVIDETGWEQVGDGQVHSNLHDLALWDENFYTGEVGGRAVIDQMLEAGRLNSGESTDYGGGLSIEDSRGLTWVRHGGSWVGYRSNITRVPSEHFTVIVLCNRSEADAGELATSVAEIFLKDKLAPAEPEKAEPEAEPAAPEWAPKELSRYAGAYLSEEADVRCVIDERGGKLVLEGCARGELLRPGKAGEFVTEGGLSLRFGSGEEAGDSFIYWSPGLRGLPFTKIRDANELPTSTLIVNASIVDGTGGPARAGAVRIDGDRIVEVGALVPRDGETVVDAGGATLAPGFIDVHSHHEEGLFEMPDASPVVSQGITTIVAGQDGSMTYGVRELFERMQMTPVAINVATYVGHGNLREDAMGKDDYRRHATAEEIESMRQGVADGMEAGALGLATGLEYDPGIYSATDEVIALAQVAARHGGRYISHVRSEDRDFWAAIDEIVRIGREAKIPVEVTHLKLAMKDWWGQSARLLAILDEARAAGIDVTADIYPYEYWHSDLTVLFPKRDFTDRETAQFVLDHVTPANGIILTDYSPEPALVGRSLAEIAKSKGTDPAAELMDLIARSSGENDSQSIMGRGMIEPDIDALIVWPHAAICSDGSLESLHPRGRGAFTKVLREYVREKKLLSLEEAVRKMTGLSAANVGIADRGAIRPGTYADLVLFDPATVADRSTFEDPAALSVGIEMVWVNGVAVWQDGKATGARPGRGIRKP